MIMTMTAPTKKWLMNVIKLEADCDISAGPVLPPVKVSSDSRATNGHSDHGHPRKATTTFRPVRRTLVKG